MLTSEKRRYNVTFHLVTTNLCCFKLGFINEVHYVHHIVRHIIDSDPNGVASTFGKCGFF